MSLNPELVLREFHEAVRAAQHELAKARSIAQAIAATKNRVSREEQCGALLRRLDRAQGLVESRSLTQWRQEHMPPREARRQVAPGAPDDLVCKKCGEQRDREAFFFDDGNQRGYTGRCRDCRRATRKREARSGVRDLVTGKEQSPSRPPEKAVGGASGGTEG